MSENVAAPLPGSHPARWEAIPLQNGQGWGCFFPPKPGKWGKKGKADWKAQDCFGGHKTAACAPYHP